MREQVWIDLLRRIPAACHDGLIVATVTGADIVMQSVVSLDEHFLILRGRPAGTSESGRLMILPYHQINYLYFPPKLTEQQMQELFGAGAAAFADLPAVKSAAPPETVANPEPPSSAEAAPVAANASAAEASPSNGTPANGSASQTPQHSKSVLLAKLRAKLAGNGTKAPRSSPSS